MLFTLHHCGIFVLNSPPLNQSPLLPDHILPAPTEKLRALLGGYDLVLSTILSILAFNMTFRSIFGEIVINFSQAILLMQHQTLRYV